MRGDSFSVLLRRAARGAGAAGRDLLLKTIPKYLITKSCFLLKTAFLLGDTIYSPKIFGGTTLGVGLNVADNTGVLLPNGATIYYTNEQDRTRGL